VMRHSHDRGSGIELAARIASVPRVPISPGQVITPVFRPPGRADERAAPASSRVGVRRCKDVTTRRFWLRLHHSTASVGAQGNGSIDSERG